MTYFNLHDLKPKTNLYEVIRFSKSGRTYFFKRSKLAEWFQKHCPKYRIEVKLRDYKVGELKTILGSKIPRRSDVDPAFANWLLETYADWCDPALYVNKTGHITILYNTFDFEMRLVIPNEECATLFKLTWM